MKFLDYPELESLSRDLTFESAECKVFTRIEAYSCKAVKRERQLFKTLETQYLQSASLSPPNHIEESLASPFGRLDQSHARKTLFLLIATLNGAFPDHDFSGVHPSDFRREGNSDSVLNSLGTTLTQLRSNSNAPRSFSSFPSSYDEEDRASRSGRQMAMGKINHPQLDAVLDDIMCIRDCEVFTFHPDADSDPHASAEPDEEGDELDDERYADDESGSDGDQIDDGVDTRMSTPQQRASSSFDDEMDDAPMFDEDLLGFGFTPVHSRVSSTVTTPRTPSSAVRARPGDFFSSKKRGSSGRAMRTATLASSAPGRMGHSTLSSRMSAVGTAFGNKDDSMFAEDSFDEDFDDEQGLNGLLWATYAFFYNRKQKRILFVSVWSRRNNAGPVSYSFSPPSYPTIGRQTDDVPPLSIEQAITSKGAEQVSSPAKRAIARTTGPGSRLGRTIQGTKRGRDLSASPAPSSRSPFPHDSPQRVKHHPDDVKANAVLVHQLAESTTAEVEADSDVGSHSVDSSIGAPPVIGSSLSSSHSSTKRGTNSFVDGAQQHHPIDQSARKQRRVNAISS